MPFPNSTSFPAPNTAIRSRLPCNSSRYPFSVFRRWDISGTYNKERVLDIQEAIASIQERVDVKQQFDGDDMLRVWCLHHLIIIGEAAARISTSFREAYPAVPWKRITAMRNAVVHGYFQVDWQEVWSVVEKDIPQLKVDIDAIVWKEGWV